MVDLDDHVREAARRLLPPAHPARLLVECHPADVWTDTELLALVRALRARGD